MNPVKLLKHDTCYTYALKRIGIFSLENVLLSGEEFINKCMIDRPTEKELIKGDLLVRIFNNENSGIFSANILLEDGKILSSFVRRNIHFMVYEGLGIISEAMYIDSGFMNIQYSLLNRFDFWERLKLKNYATKL